MSWFGKKEEIPEIPLAPTLPEFQKSFESERNNLPELPSFPANEPKTTLDSARVKSTVPNISGENEVNLDELQVKEEPIGGVQFPPRPSAIPELPRKIEKRIEPQKKTLELAPPSEFKPISKQIEPIFVRIDKFQSAQKNFEQIKEKVKEIESALRKIKEVKSKEEEEIVAWSGEVEKLKSRLAELDSSIFDQI